MNLAIHCVCASLPSIPTLAERGQVLTRPIQRVQLRVV